MVPIFANIQPLISNAKQFFLGVLLGVYKYQKYFKSKNKNKK
jgi:hypothetical protein